VRSFRFLLPILALVGLVGCAPEEEASRSAGPRVALMTTGPGSDAGWYAGAYEGLQLLASEMDARISHQQTRTPAEFDEAMISYAGDGYGLVFAHGFEYQDAALRVAPRFPETTFVISGGSTVRENVIPMIFQLEEATYLAGMAAGALTDSDIIGMVGGVAIPNAVGAFDAFEAGVAAVNPDARVLTTWIGSWDDVAAAKEATVAQLEQGADIVVHNTDGASFGIFQAVREAREAGRDAYAIGMNRDQNDVAPEVIIGSAVIRIPQGMRELAESWAEGTLGAEAFYAGGEGGVVDYVVNPALEQLYSAELLERIDEARTGIRDGTLEIPRVSFVDEGG